MISGSRDAARAAPLWKGLRTKTTWPKGSKTLSAPMQIGEFGRYVLRREVHQKRQCQNGYTLEPFELFSGAAREGLLPETLEVTGGQLVASGPLAAPVGENLGAHPSLQA